MAKLTGEARARFVSTMFARIAPRYDLLNTLMTFGMHHRWRALAARLALQGLRGPALDIGAGTGDLALALARRPESTEVTGLDFVPEMLALGRKKAAARQLGGKVRFVEGDALSLPFADGAFVTAASAFTLRNIPDPGCALWEMLRVVRPGGRIVVLEIASSRRRGLGAFLFRLYFRHVPPLLGQLFAGDRGAYTYLPDSVEGFFRPEELVSLMQRAGCAQVRHRLVGAGTVAIHVGEKATG